MANLSWQFYKGYYRGENGQDFPYWSNFKDKDQEKRVKEFFDGKNQPFLKFKIDAVQRPSYKVVSHRFQLVTTYPGLLIGSGYAHGIGATGEFKIGFHLDYTTGEPIIPGSSIKGVLRSVFPGFTEEDKEAGFDEAKVTGKEKLKAKLEKARFTWWLLKGENKEKLSEGECKQLYELEQVIFIGKNPVWLKASDVERKDKCILEYLDIYHRDIFHEVIISAENKGKVFETDFITPHENPLKNPIPLQFLKVGPGVTFEFRFDLNAPEVYGFDAEEKEEIFQKILTTIGIGAKTNVGYGQFEASEEEKQKLAQIEKQRELEIKKKEEEERLKELQKSPEYQLKQKLKKGMEYECYISNIDKNYCYFMFDWDEEFEFKKKISKTGIPNPQKQMRVKISIGDDYITGVALNFNIMS